LAKIIRQEALHKKDKDEDKDKEMEDALEEKERS